MSKPSTFRWTTIGCVLTTILVLDFGTKQVGNFFQAGRLAKSPPAAPLSRVAPHRTFDPRYHHGFVPGSSGSEQYGPFVAKYFINSLGMRDASSRQVPLGKPPGGRILLLGDSYIDGVGLDFPETLAAQLAEAVAGRGVEVLNGGVASFCPTLMEARLRSWVEKDGLEFDLVVVFIDISDTDNELRYQQDSSGLFLPADAPEFAQEVAAVEQKELWFRQWLQTRVERNFVLLGALARNVRQFYERLGSPGSATPYVFSEWPGYRGPLEPWIQKSLRRQAAAMDRLLDLCGRQKAPVVIVVYPWLEQIHRGETQNRHSEFWREWARGRQVPFLSLYPLFASLRGSIEEYHLEERDGHWSRQGHGIVARELLQFLESQKLLVFHEKS